MYIQQKLNQRCQPCSEADFHRTLSDPTVARTIASIREVQAKMNQLTASTASTEGSPSTSSMDAQTLKEYNALHDEKSRLKRQLPAFLYLAHAIDLTEKKIGNRSIRAQWRKAEAIHLNGLFLVDIDGISDPRKAWEEGIKRLGLTPILLAHITPSGCGLRIIAKARPEWSLFENARQFCRVFGGEPDEACKDPSRISFACTEADVLHLDPELFSYYNKAYDDLWTPRYQKGNVQGPAVGLEKPTNRGLHTTNTAAEASTAGASTAEGTAGASTAEGTAAGASTAGANGVGSPQLVGFSKPTAPSSCAPTAPSSCAPTAPSSCVPTAPSSSAPTAPSSCVPTALRRNADGAPLLTPTVTYASVYAALLKDMGGVPAMGMRNNTYYRLAAYARYICNDNLETMLATMPAFGLSEQERRQTLTSALKDRAYRNLPKRLQKVLAALGVTSDGSATAGSSSTSAALSSTFDHQRYYDTFHPFFNGPWTSVVNSIDPKIQLAAFLAAGAMFGTYLSPVTLINYPDGSDYRLSFMTYIIGQSGSGKGEIKKLDQLIMQPMRQEDALGREAEDNFKIIAQQRELLSKEQRKNAPDIPHAVIRYLPSAASNAMRYRRMKNAVINWNGQDIPLHIYTFESELASMIKMQKDSWAASQDNECKSFSNEYGGNDYTNSLATNGPIQINQNLVITGTQNALNHKINERNCTDGLATRLTLFEMPSNEYKMYSRSHARRTAEEQAFLSTVGTKLEKFRGYLDLEQNVSVPREWQYLFGKETSIADAMYQWGCEEADRCKEEDDHTADYFRKRAPVAAARYAAVDAVMRCLDSFPDDEPLHDAGKVTTTFPSVLLAYRLASYIQEAQMYFFGGMVEKVIGEERQYGNVKKKDIASKAKFVSLPDAFTMADLLHCYANKKTANVILARWTAQGLITREGPCNKLVYHKVKTAATPKPSLG